MFVRYVQIFFLLVCLTTVKAQQPFLLNNNEHSRWESFTVLQDNGYAIQQLATDTTLHFNAPQPIKNVAANSYYWIKFIATNPSSKATNLYAWVFPQFENELFYFDKDSHSWKSNKAGLGVVNKERRYGMMPFAVEGKSTDTFYVKVFTGKLAPSKNAIQFGLHFYSEASHKSKEQFMLLLWIATLVVLVIFFVYNLYIYLTLKDATYLYYLIIVASGIIYITAINQFFNILLPIRNYTIDVTSNGIVFFCDLNNVCIQIAIIGVMFGYIQFTKKYIQLSYYLPKFNIALTYIQNVFIATVAINTFLTATGILYTDRHFLKVENYSIMLIILLLFVVGILVMRKGVQQAKYFLIANSLPLIIMLALAAYFVINTTYGNGAVLLPNIALVVQTLTFAIALVWRIKSLKNELIDTQEVSKSLENKFALLAQRNQEIELENKEIANNIALHIHQKETLQVKLDANQRELASNTLYLLQKNEVLAGLQKQITQLSNQQSTHAQKQAYKEIKSTLQNSVQLDNEWDKFKIHFEQVHPNFFTELEKKYPYLTAYEIRLCAYLHLKMATKEIAALLNIDANSVHRAKTRLKKKMNIQV